MRNLVVIIMLLIFNHTFAQENLLDIYDYVDQRTKKTLHIMQDLQDISVNLISNQIEYNNYSEIRSVADGLFAQLILIKSLTRIGIIGWVNKDKISSYTEMVEKDYIKGKGGLYPAVKVYIGSLDKYNGWTNHSGLKRAIKDLTNICVEIRDKYRD